MSSFLMSSSKHSSLLFQNNFSSYQTFFSLSYSILGISIVIFLISEFLFSPILSLIICQMKIIAVISAILLWVSSGFFLIVSQSFQLFVYIIPQFLHTVCVIRHCNLLVRFLILKFLIRSLRCPWHHITLILKFALAFQIWITVVLKHVSSISFLSI